eukprot:jgi/Mesen1/3662/ME000202S02750
MTISFFGKPAPFNKELHHLASGLCRSHCRKYAFTERRSCLPILAVDSTGYAGAADGSSDAASKPLDSLARSFRGASPRSGEKKREGNVQGGVVKGGSAEERPSEADVVVIGAGIGGLCCAALLAKYGYKTQTYVFGSPPVLTVLDVLGETVECVRYKNWTGYLPEGAFNFVADRDAYRAEIRRVGGEAQSGWRQSLLLIFRAPRAKNSNWENTITAEMAFMFWERNRPEGTIDYPLGGGGALIDALVRGLTKYGGQLLLGTHIEEIIVQDGRACGKFPPLIRATKAVVSNASIWDTTKLLPKTAEGLPPDLECHHLIVNSWEAGVEAPQNVIIVSIPTIFDASLAPPGKHVVHAYTAGNEPYSIWEGMDRKSEEYAKLKAERAEVLWRALERAIPDIRQRTEFEIIGTPLTHERYLRRTRGTYGPAVKAGKADWPGPRTEVPGLLVCGDSTMPGIGVPAVAASGLMAANAVLPVWHHWDMLDTIETAATK